jgi:hypothetical protein
MLLGEEKKLYNTKMKPLDVSELQALRPRNRVIHIDFEKTLMSNLCELEKVVKNITKLGVGFDGVIYSGYLNDYLITVKVSREASSLLERDINEWIYKKYIRTKKLMNFVICYKTAVCSTTQSLLKLAYGLENFDQADVRMTLKAFLKRNKGNKVLVRKYPPRVKHVSSLFMYADDQKFKRENDKLSKELTKVLIGDKLRLFFLEHVDGTGIHHLRDNLSDLSVAFLQLFLTLCVVHKDEPRFAHGDISHANIFFVREDSSPVYDVGDVGKFKLPNIGYTILFGNFGPQKVDTNQVFDFRHDVKCLINTFTELPLTELAKLVQKGNNPMKFCANPFVSKYKI